MIRMYDDRLEFESPGRPPGIIRLHNIKDIRYSRNPRIAVMLSEFKYVRRWGEGIDRIYDEMQLFHLEPPELAETDQTFYPNPEKQYRGTAITERVICCIKYRTRTMVWILA